MYHADCVHPLYSKLGPKRSGAKVNLAVTNALEDMRLSGFICVRRAHAAPCGPPTRGEEARVCEGRIDSSALLRRKKKAAAPAPPTTPFMRGAAGGKPPAGGGGDASSSVRKAHPPNVRTMVSNFAHRHPHASSSSASASSAASAAALAPSPPSGPREVFGADWVTPGAKNAGGGGQGGGQGGGGGRDGASAPAMPLPQHAAAQAASQGPSFFDDAAYASDWSRMSMPSGFAAQQWGEDGGGGGGGGAGAASPSPEPHAAVAPAPAPAFAPAPAPAPSLSPTPPPAPLRAPPPWHSPARALPFSLPAGVKTELDACVAAGVFAPSDLDEDAFATLVRTTMRVLTWHESVLLLTHCVRVFLCPSTRCAAALSWRCSSWGSCPAARARGRRRSSAKTRSNWRSWWHPAAAATTTTLLLLRLPLLRRLLLRRRSHPFPCRRRRSSSSSSWSRPGRRCSCRRRRR
jgi:hypothetical protein